MFDATSAEKRLSVSAESIGRSIERKKKGRRRIQIVKGCQLRCILIWRGEEWVRALLKIRDRSGKLALLSGITSSELLALGQPRTVAQLAKTMLERSAKIAAQLVHIFR
jgi:hypothetical protein